MRAPYSVISLAFAAVLLLAAPGALVAGSDASIDDSGLLLSVLGQDKGLFSLARVNEGSDVVRYELGTETRVIFRLADGKEGVFDNPLFCFDFDVSGGAVVSLEALNSSGHSIFDNVGLASVLAYQVSNGEIVFTPSASTQCFYVSSDAAARDASFGLFGVPPSTTDGQIDPDDLIFSNRFELIQSIRVAFEGLPDSVLAGNTLDYGIVIENTGDVAVGELAFQEVFPGNANYFDAALDPGEWICTLVEQNRVAVDCPESASQGSIRFKGLPLAPGEVVRYEISRKVDANAAGGSTIVMYAGAVDGPGQDALFDVDRAEITVIGAPARLAFTTDNPTVAVGSTQSLTLEVQDADGSRVLGDERTIRLSKVAGSGIGVVTFDEFQAVSDGKAEIPVVGSVVGDLRLIAVTVDGSPVDAGQISLEVTEEP